MGKLKFDTIERILSEGDEGTEAKNPYGDRHQVLRVKVYPGVSGIPQNLSVSKMGQPAKVNGKINSQFRRSKAGLYKTNQCI